MVNYQINDNVFREYDIRGIVDNDFSKEFIYNLGQAIGTHFISLNERSIGVSGDLRETTKFIREHLIEGLLNTGINVVDLGCLPTPVNYYSMYVLDNINCSIQITGSHNSMDYNGFKISYNRAPFYGKNIQILKEIMNKDNYKKGKGVLSKTDLLPRYSKLLKDKISINRKLSISMDCLNSCGTLIAPQIFKDLGVDLHEINCNSNQQCPSESPDPTIDSNLVNLVDSVLKQKCDFGIAYDGDADRLVVIDEKGQIIRSDILLAFFIKELINKGDSVVFDVKCSKSVEDIIKLNNAKPIMSKTGHSYIKEKMKESEALIGGEMSGHLFFQDDYYGYDDAIYASLRLAELIANSSRTLSQIIDSIPSYYSSPEIRIECNNDKEKFIITNKLVSYFSKRYNCNCIDGVRIQFKNGWGLIRASNTQPVLVCRFESESEDSLKEIESIIMGKIKFYLND